MGKAKCIFSALTWKKVGCEETSCSGFNVLKDLVPSNGEFNSLAIENAYVNKLDTFQ